MAAHLGLGHVVITSVTRDDLEDGGAGHIAATIREVRDLLPRATVEVLTPDFQGEPAAVARVLEAGADVFNHNLETVPRLYPAVRPQADYRRSLGVLALARRLKPRLFIKSGLMVGLGETFREVEETLRDLHGAGAGIVTIGQYLQPARGNLPVAEYVAPSRFEAYREYGLALGFQTVSSGPFVRSSYRAGAVLREAGVSS
jgi:lipoic acid synthetase